MKKFLLASDLDGTVIPLEDEPEWEEEIAHFGSLVSQQDGLTLAYVTGRHLDLALDGVAQRDLPLPDIMVCDVGTTIYIRNGVRWEVDDAYRRRLGESWRGKSSGGISELLAGVEGLEEQEAEKQGEFKQSYYIPSRSKRENILQKVEEILQQAGLKTNLIFSVDSFTGSGLLDILPGMAAKDKALDYLQELLQIPKEHIVYAGDSGNDLAAFVSGYNAIVVANTAGPVCEETIRLAREKGIESRVFFARHKYTRGVIEGCRHFNIFE